MSIECTPTKSRPGSAVKQGFLTGSSIGTRSNARHGQMHPALLRASPVKKKLFEEQILRSAGRHRTVADPGFHTQGDIHHSSIVVIDPDSTLTPSKRRTRATEKKVQASPDSATRCICRETDEDGGTTMVQWYVLLPISLL